MYFDSLPKLMDCKDKILTHMIHDTPLNFLVQTSKNLHPISTLVHVLQVRKGTAALHRAFIMMNMDDCHDRDRTYPYSPYSDLSTPILSHLNHSQAPNAKPEPSDPLASQQRTPEHSDSLASSQHIPDPTHLRPFLSLASSQHIPDPTHLRPFLSLASSQFLTSTLIPDPMPFNLLCSCIKSIPDVSSVS